jgi:hypothetical protein
MQGDYPKRAAPATQGESPQASNFLVKMSHLYCKEDGVQKHQPTQKVAHEKTY